MMMALVNNHNEGRKNRRDLGELRKVKVMGERKRLKLGFVSGKALVERNPAEHAQR